MTSADLAWPLETFVARVTMTPVVLLAVALVPFGFDLSVQHSPLPGVEAAPK